MIELAHISKSYPGEGLRRTVLSDVSLSIGLGEFVAIVGVSGSGKSTLLNVMGGLDRDFSGSAKVAGEELPLLSDGELSRFRNQSIGFVFQSFNLLAHLSALENVLLPAVFAPGGKDLLPRAEEVLARVGLKERMHQKPNTLSGGERQRTAIARSLLLSPRILLCDEPTGNLDYATADEVLGIFQGLNRDDKITLIIVTHEDRVAALAPRVITLKDGVVLSDKKQIVEGRR